MLWVVGLALLTGAAWAQPDIVVNMINDDSAHATPYPNPIVAGARLHYRVEVRNNDLAGPAATGVQLVLTLDNKISISGGNVPTFTTSKGTCSLATRTLTCSIGSVQHNNAEAVVVNLYATPIDSGVIEMGISSSTDQGDSNTTNNTRTPGVNGVQTTVNRGSDLELQGRVTTSNAAPNPGVNYNYVLTVRNHGPHTTGGTTTVTNTLPTGVTYVSTSATGWTCNVAGQVVTCTNSAAVASGADFNPITITVTPMVSGTLTNNASVAFAGGGGTPSSDYNAANNNGTVNVTVAAGTDLGIQNSEFSATVPARTGATTTTSFAPNEVVRFSVRPRFFAGGVPTGGQVTRVQIPFTAHPSYWTNFTNFQGAGFWTCNYGTTAANTVTCDHTGDYTGVGNTPPQDLPTFTFDVKALNSGGSNLNDTLQATVSLVGGTETNSFNNSQSMNVIIANPVPDISIGKTRTTPATGVNVNLNNTVTFDITVRNENVAVSTGGPIRVVETLEAPLRWGSASIALNSGYGQPADASQWTCTQNGDYASSGKITCTLPGGLPWGRQSTLRVTTRAVSVTDPNKVDNTAQVYCDPGCVGNSVSTNDIVRLSTKSPTPEDFIIYPDGANLSITKVMTASTYAPNGNPWAGDQVTYTLTATNNSASVTATGVYFIDVLKVYSGVASATWNNSGAGTSGNCDFHSATSALPGNKMCTSGDVGCPSRKPSDTNLTLRCNVSGNVGPGQSVTATINMRPYGLNVGGSAASLRAHNNGTPETGVFATSGVATGSSNIFTSTNFPIAPNADLSAIMTATPASVAAGALLTYTIGVTNNGPHTPSNGATVTSSPFPANVTVGTMPTGCTFSGATRRVTCTATATDVNFATGGGGGTYSAKTKQWAFDVRPTVPYPSNSLSISATVAAVSVADLNNQTYWDRNSANNTATASNTVTNPDLDLLVVPSDTPDPQTPNLNSVHSIRITNNTGPSLSTNTVVTLTPPAGVTVYTVSGTATVRTGADCAGGTLVRTINPFTCSAVTLVTDQRTCTIGDLDADQSACFTVDLTSNVAGVYSNGVSVSSTEVAQGYDRLAGNNTRSENTTFAAGNVISGKVYLDVNNNGTVDSGENGISGVTINLSGTATATTTTNAQGDYAFTGLANGTYVVTEPTQPAGTINGITSVGTSNTGAATAVGVVPSEITGIPQTSVNNNFGERPATTGSISGKVYIDANNNGTVNTGEVGIGSITVQLTPYTFGVNGVDDGGTGDDVLGTTQTTTTNAVGDYTFSGLAAGTYKVTEPNQPSGTINGITTAGSVGGTVTNVATTPSVISKITINGHVATGYNFGERYFPSLSGKVYVDSDHDGVVDAGESGISGVSVTISGNTTQGVSVCLSINCTVTTDSNGNYTFPTVPAGTYTLTEQHPTAYKDGYETAGNLGGNAPTAIPATDNATNFNANASQNAISNIVVANTDGTGYNFGERVGTLTGKVYNDQNNNGANNSEPGIAGVTVTLTGTNLLSQAVSQTAVTDANGNYTFTNLLGANATGYTITETQPSGWLNRSHSIGKVDGSDCGPCNNQTVNVISAVPFSPAQAFTEFDFGEILAVSLSGKVYVDDDNDGVVDSGESGIATVTLTLSGFTSNSVNVCTVIGLSNCTVTTDASGNYSFAAVPPSDATGYTITETHPAGYADGKETKGNLTANTPANTTFTTAAGDNQITGIIVASTSGSGFNFGERAGSITGKVYEDQTHDFALNTGEPGISGVTLTLSGRDARGNTVSRTTTTDANGNYTFSGVLTSNATGYTITETQPSGWLNSGQSRGLVDGVNCGACVGTTVNVISAIPFSAAQAFTEFNFGEIRGGSISGKVYHDVRPYVHPVSGATVCTLGTFDCIDTGLGGVTLTLTGTDDLGAAVNRTTTTASDGTYSFTGLRPADGTGQSTSYTIAETQPAATVYKDFTSPSTDVGSMVGTIDGTTKGTPALNQISDILLSVGKSGINYDFREDASAFVGGLVFLDDATGGGTFNNGVKDGAETGLSGVTVTLTASGSGACSDGTSRCTAVTDAQGVFNFVGLRAGTYTMVETQPITKRDGKEVAGTAGGDVDNSNVSDAATVRGFQDQHNRIANIAIGSAVNASGYAFAELQGVQATVAGRAWMKKSFSESTTLRGASSPRLTGWIVKLFNSNGSLAKQTTTDSQGNYSMTAVTPDNNYVVRFYDPFGRLVGGVVDNTEVTNTRLSRQLTASKTGDATLQGDRNSQLTVPVYSGDEIDGLDLAIDPSGVVYDALTRQPVAGAVVTISGPAGFDASIHVVGGSGSQTTDSTGVYQYFLNQQAMTDLRCDISDCVFTLAVTQVPSGYQSGASTLIPSCTANLRVTNLNPAYTQAQAEQPGVSVSQAGTCSSTTLDTGNTFASGETSVRYYFNFIINSLSGNVINNHIPIDPVTLGSIVMTKTTPKINVVRGELVPYTLTAQNTLTGVNNNVNLVDDIPPGFKYRLGSARIDGVASEPGVSGRRLTWRNQSFTAKGTAGATKTIKMILVVGSGVGEGKYTNTTWAVHALSGLTLSNVATATVRIVPDPVMDCTDIIGKVFDDKNRNGYQDEGEPGIADVRITTAQGLLVTSDAMGRFHVTCAMIPQAERGSNFFMKLDERTLPSGYRITTENPREVRATRGKLVKLNFGAAIHHVIRLELSDEAFVGDEAELIPALTAALDALPDTLRKQPSIIRLAYLQAAAQDGLIKARLKKVREVIEKHWKEIGCCYTLQFEEEVVKAGLRSGKGGK